MIRRSSWTIGSRQRFLGVVLTLVAASMIAFPASSPARPTNHYVVHPYRAIRFQVHGSHGYEIGVAQGSRGHFVVHARRGPVTTEYAGRAPRSLSKYEVRGKIGDLGRFDVRFAPHGPPRHLPRYRFCTGPGPTIQPGIVHGTIRFRAEHGYTRAIAGRASAELETLPSQRCHYGESGHSKHPPQFVATLSADHETGGPGVHFSAYRFAPGSRPPGHRAFYEASDYERHGSVSIIRKIRLAAETSTFLLPDFATAPETAVIRPPAPFSGSATFARTPESTFTWTGDLAVSFPGINPLPLAGPDFRLYYCALRSCVDQESPAER